MDLFGGRRNSIHFGNGLPLIVDDLSPLQKDFVDASVLFDDSLIAAEEDQKQQALLRQTRESRFLRITAMVFASLLALSAVAIVIAVNSLRDYEEQKDIAEEHEVNALRVAAKSTEQAYISDINPCTATDSSE